MLSSVSLARKRFHHPPTKSRSSRLRRTTSRRRFRGGIMTSRRVIHKESRQVSQIRPFLYVGGLAGLSPRILSKFSITVNLIPGFRLSSPPHMRVVHIPLMDEENTELSAFWTTVFQEIDDARKTAGRCLLLCAMGISRSATFAISYLMCIEKMTLHDAYKHVQSCRNIICPNVGFFQQMIDLETKLRGKSTVKIIEPIPGVKVADVVWNELYEEMMTKMNESDRHSLRSLNINLNTNNSSNDTRSLRSLNMIDESKVDDTSRSLASFRLNENIVGTSASGSSISVGEQKLPKSALRDKSREKKKRWRLSFSKDVITH